MAKPTLSQQVADLTAIVAALAEQQGTTTTKGKTPTKGKTQSPVRRVKQENLDRPASQKQILGAFFEAFQVIYGEKLDGWPTRGDVEAIRDDLQKRIA